jgi:hypothetical protein
MNSSPIKRTCAVTALVLGGATAGVVAAKFWAPGWLATPWSASAFVSAITHTDGRQPATQPAIPFIPGVVDVKAPLPASPATSSNKAVATAPAPHPVAVRAAAPQPAPSHPSEPASPPPAPVAEDPAVRRSVRSFLLTCRSQMEMYKSQHGGRLPEFSKYPAWHQFTQKTRADGTPAADGEFGPYLLAAPVNPINGFGGIGLVRTEPRPGQVMRGEKLGFVICSATGAVFATDKDGKTIVNDAPAAKPVAATPPTSSPPVPASAAPAAPVARSEPSLPAPHPMPGTPQQRADALMSQLQMLRTEIEMYKLQHTDLAPDFPRFPFWEQMARRTRGDGAIDGKGSFGPYLDRRPVNPMNGFTKIECVPRVAYDYQVGGQQIGYVFDTSTGRLMATDDKGGIWRE